MRGVVIFVLLITLGFSLPTNAQSLLTTKNVEFRFENYLLRSALLGEDKTLSSDFLREYYTRADAAVPGGAYLTTYTARMYGLEIHKMSTVELALEGAGTAATMGLFVGAVANTLGIWDEDTTWLLVGAMSALGAARGASRADDPKFNMRVRWDRDDR
jgi:hypothetical protein